MSCLSTRATHQCFDSAYLSLLLMSASSQDTLHVCMRPALSLSMELQKHGGSVTTAVLLLVLLLVLLNSRNCFRVLLPFFLGFQ